MNTTYSAKMQKLLKRNDRFRKGVTLLVLSVLLLIFALAFPKILTSGGRELTRIQTSIANYLPRLPIAVGLIGIYLTVRSYLERKNKLSFMSPELLKQADQELQNTEAYIPGVRIYVTPHFLVANEYDLEVIPWSKISHVTEIQGILSVFTFDGKGHAIVSGCLRKPWSKGLELTIKEKMNEAAEEVKKQDQNRKVKLAELEKIAKSIPLVEEREFKAPSAVSAWSGGIFMALCGAVILMFINGFRISGPLIGGVTIYFMTSFGFCFGIPGMLHCGPFLDFWRPDAGRIPGLVVSLIVTAAAEGFYHALLLVTGYKDYGYSFFYAADHLFELLKLHKLWSLFLNRTISAVGIVLVMGVCYEGLRLYRTGGKRKMEV